MNIYTLQWDEMITTKWVRRFKVPAKTNLTNEIWRRLTPRHCITIFGRKAMEWDGCEWYSENDCEMKSTELSQIEPENCPSRCEWNRLWRKWLAEKEVSFELRVKKRWGSSKKRCCGVRWIGECWMDGRLTKFFRKPIPENWGMMCEWPVCYLKTRVDCGGV